MKLNIIEKVPNDLYTCDVKDIHDVLNGPTILHLKGKSSKALFISTLLHGNETTSFFVIQKLLKEYKEKEIPRDLIIFIGNTIGASHGLRHLPDQPDYNRIWKEGDTPEHLLATEVFVYAKQHDLFASIDIHNNTGKNPFYACINLIHDNWVELGSLFSNQIVYFTEPSEVQSMAFAELCPSVTIEAGLPGNAEGTEVVFRFLDDVMNLDSFKDKFSKRDADVFHTIGRIHISKDATVDFDNNIESENDISFISNIDSMNFELLKRGDHLGFCKNALNIQAYNNRGDEISNDIFDFTDGKITANRIFIPSMFTKDVYVMKEDCLGYIMEKMISLKD